MTEILLYAVASGLCSNGPMIVCSRVLKETENYYFLIPALEFGHRRRVKKNTYAKSPREALNRHVVACRKEIRMLKRRMESYEAGELWALNKLNVP